jgi:hypothetical protein
VSVTRLAVLLGVLLLGLLCWAAAGGMRAAYELLVSFAVLVVLVAGGNWLGGRRTPDVEPYRPPSGTYERSASVAGVAADPSGAAGDQSGAAGELAGVEPEPPAS